MHFTPDEQESLSWSNLLSKACYARVPHTASQGLWIVPKLHAACACSVQAAFGSRRVDFKIHLTTNTCDAALSARGLYTTLQDS